MIEARYPQNPVVLVDDDSDVLSGFQAVLSRAGINNIIALQNAKQFFALVSKQPIEVLLLDLALPDISGEQTLDLVSRDFPQVPIIVVSASGELRTAVRCMRGGATDYLVKPVESAKLVASVKQNIELQEWRRENSALKHYVLSDGLANPRAFENIITQNSEMISVFRYVESVAVSSRPVLILGETGVGKELIAGCIHHISNRTGKFVSVNVAGLDDTLFTDTLFGHEKGAFTGAERKREGLIQQAAGGTLFLDEIGDLEIASQVKLLRVLQDGEYYSLGADQPNHTDARVIVCTHQDLGALQSSGKFRKDLYFRLSTHSLEIPPLRNRLDDLPLLLNYYLEFAAKSQGKRKPTYPGELITLLSTYHFPGNVRELESMVIDSVAQHRFGTLSMASFRRSIGREVNRNCNLQNAANGHTVDSEEALVIDQYLPLPSLKHIEQFAIKEAMRRAHSNQSIAAQLLGMPRQTLQRRIKQYNLTAP